MNKYPAYKDSGIEWIGEIPEHWEVRRMRYLCDIGTGAKDTENKEENGEYPFYVRSQTVERISTYSFDGEAILTAGDGVGVCKVWHYVNGKFDYHQRVYRMSHFGDIQGKYLFYYLKENFIKEVMKLSAKSTVDSLRRPMFQDFKVVFGTKNEQLAITSFLDKKTALIDTLISNKQKLIKLLIEEHTAIINQAVTKGLDPNVAMKDSGIEWLGAIPEHWELKKLKYVAKINPSKPSASFDKNSDNEVVFLPMEKVSENGMITQDIRKRISEVSSGFTYFEKNDVLVAKITPCFENGKGALLNNLITDFGFGSTEFHTIRSTDKILKEFIFYLTKSEKFMTIGEAFMTGSAGQKRVPTDFLKEFKIGLPKLIEQQEIVTYIQDAQARVDVIITKTQQEIDLLKEYKTALISEVITGKVDVREEILEETCSSF